MDARTFDVSIRHQGDETIVTCRGELDIATTDRLDEALGLCLDRSPSRLSVDCSRLSFVDSSGIRSLIMLAQRCEGAGIDLAVRPSEPLRKIATVLGVAQVLRLADQGPDPQDVAATGHP